MLSMRVFETMNDLFETAGSAVLQSIHQRERAVIALSGGSTPRGLYTLLGSSEWRLEMEGKQVLWVTGDERCVPREHPDSNAGMIDSTLFAGGLLPKHQFLRFRTELGEPAAIAAKFEQEWRELGIEGIDLAILGVGDDGHTASLFPGTDVLALEERVASEVYVPRLDSWRVTVTAPVLRESASKIVLATGPSKRPVIQALQRGEQFPISSVIDGGGPAWWLIDRDAYPEAKEKA
jgi:6-phosphogluconolactonase